MATVKANKRASKKAIPTERPHSRGPRTVEAINAMRVGRRETVPAADAPEAEVADLGPVDTEAGVPEAGVADLKAPAGEGVHSRSARKIDNAGPAFR